jgi:glycosyltransferase involved in cell wall biosynthesis
MRVLICRSNPISPDPRVEKEAHSLANGGFEVKALGWDRSGELPVEETLNGVMIVRLPIKAGFGKGIRNLPQLLRWQFHLLVWLLRHRKEFDAIHACDFDTVLPAVVLKKLAGKKVIYDIFDFYADHLRATPGLIKKLIRAVDIRVIGMVDGLILADETRREQVAAAKPRHLEVIYNSPADLTASERAEKIGESRGGLTIAYVGLLQIERGLYELVEVVGKHPDWTLHLAGYGGDEEEILAKALKFPNLKWYGRVPYSKALELSFAANVLIATYDPSIPNHRYSSPNKVFEAMMLAKPVIVAKDTNMDCIIEKAGCGLVVEYGNAAYLEAALEKLWMDPGLGVRLGLNGRKAYLECYSWDLMEDKLLRLYRLVQAGS